MSSVCAVHHYEENKTLALSDVLYVQEVPFYIVSRYIKMGNGFSDIQYRGIEIIMRQKSNFYTSLMGKKLGMG